MRNPDVVFIAATDYDHLGIGYMAAILSRSGIPSEVVDFRRSKAGILRTIKKVDPLIVGFSILYLNHLKSYAELVEYLRKGGISCHFTAGGHYASLRPEEMFELIPWLDSIVRFEGEYTFFELYNLVNSGNTWKDIKSLAYMENGRTVLNPLRRLEKDIDVFPFPVRSALNDYAFGKKFATILSGRGCVYDCSFCNSRKFYSVPHGPVKRIRKPEMVVKEMEQLHISEQCSVFLFQDDDFPVKSLKQPDWTERFCNELRRTGLDRKIIWKINCRLDEIEEETFKMMKNHGLFNIFLGIEDGTDQGLRSLNKRLTVEETLKSLDIIRELGIGFDFGFMLFQPSTTFSSLNKNLDFLKIICGDGYTPVPFQKLIPLYETRVEKELRRKKRLKVSGEGWDYDFIEEPMNRYFDFVFSCFKEWMRGAEGIENLAKWALNYFAVYKAFFEVSSEGLKLQKKIKRIISESNLFVINTMKELTVTLNGWEYAFENMDLSDKYRKEIVSKQHLFHDNIIYTMAKLVSLVEDQKIKGKI